MAYFFPTASHTFNEYLLVPDYSSGECIPDNVTLKTPLVRFRKGEEKGMFLFGGSTVVLLFEKGRVRPDKDLLINTEEGYETVVKYGERIGRAL